jgi:S-formylglutathione hydrolase FrmB
MKGTQMKVLVRNIVFILFISICITHTTADQRRSFSVDIESPSVQSSFLNNSSKQQLFIYLPPSYFDSTKHYPVAYYLHGYGGTPYEARRISGKTLDERVLSGTATEMIIVGVMGRNQFAGNFYANSPITGNWEDFLTEDVITFVDANYRTNPISAQRGIVGFSMGGSGAINTAFKHPDKFGHLFALSPGLFDINGLTNATRQWQREGWTTFLDGYGAAFAPLDNDQWQEWDPNSDLAVKAWENGFGNLNWKTEQYLKQGDTLSNITLEYGRADMFLWIQDGTKYLSDLLTKKGITANLIVHDGGHEIGPEQVNNIITFLSDAFKQ